jgi:carbon monoxide dehydrogenase subunit G
MIEIKERLELQAPPDKVWAILADPRAVVGCISGAELISENDDGSYDGKLTVHFGPMRVGFKARVTVDYDHEAMQGKIAAKGKDNHGATRMSTDADFGVEPDGDDCVVTLLAGVNLTGRLASQIESGAGMVVRRMTAEFTKKLTERVATETAPPELEAPGGDESIPPSSPAPRRGPLQRFFDWLFRRRP